MLIVRKSTLILIPIISIVIFLFVLSTDKNLHSLNVGLTELENSRNGLYKVSAKIVDINEGDFTINDGDISLRIQGKLQDKKLSNLYTQGKQLYGEIQLKKSNGMFTLVSIKRLEDGLYVDDVHNIKDKVIYNNKGLIGKFN